MFTSETHGYKLDSVKTKSNKKCSVSSMPSFVGHIGFVASLKLFLNYL